MSTISTGPGRGRGDLLETYVLGLPASAGGVQATLGTWLLRAYRLAHREADAQRVRAGLLAHHPGSPEVLSFVQLSDVQARLARATDPLAPPAPADVAVLKAVAASGTTSARVACPAARRYAPACACRFPAQVSAAVLAARASASVASTAKLGLPYPNPARDAVRVPYALPAGAGPARLEVRNALGQLVQQLDLPSAAGDSLVAGLYNCVLVVNGRYSEARRLAITK